MTEQEKDAIALGVLKVVREVARMVGSGAVPEATGCLVVDKVARRYVYGRNA